MRKQKWTDEQLLNAFENSDNIAQIISRLGLAVSGGAYSTINRELKRLGLEFKLSREERQLQGIKNHQYNTRYNEDIIFVNESSVSHTTLRKRYLAQRELTKCDKCGILDWCGEPIQFQVDHINGIRNDNRLSNLRLLCPNCHSQTPTYGGKNKLPG